MQIFEKSHIGGANGSSYKESFTVCREVLG